MVANYRCNEIKVEALDLVKVSQTQLARESSREEVQDFAKRCSAILKEAISFFE